MLDSMDTKKHPCSIFVVFGLALALAACGAPSAAPAPAPAAAPTAAPAAAEAPRPTFAGEPVKIGLQVPLSGPFAAQGLGIRKAVELLVERTNAIGGLNGREVVLLVEDDRGDPNEAVLAAERLAQQGVLAVIGGYNTAAIEPSSRVYNRDGIVQLLPACVPPLAPDRGFHQIFRVCFPEDRAAQLTSDFITDVLDAQRVAILYEGSRDATTLAGSAKSFIEQQGAQVVGFEAVNPADPDLRPVLQKVVDASPDSVYFAGSTPVAAMLLKQAPEVGLRARWTLSDSAYSLDLVPLAGLQNAVGVYLVAEPLPGNLNTPESNAFVEGFRATYGEEPAGLWPAMAADAYRLIEQGVRETGATDRQALADYLHNRLRDFPGVTGLIRGFDSKGDRLGAGNRVLVVNPDGAITPSQTQP